MKTILFQGDSITDACRSRDGEMWKGMGYPLLVTAQLSYEHPNQYTFYNRGISGNRVVDLYARIKEDILKLKPDVMSILIGVNDVWHEIKYQNGVSAKRYQDIYKMLLEDAKEALPEIKIMLLEPFLLRYTATEENWEEFLAGVLKRQEIVRILGEEFDLPVVPLQPVFDAALQQAPVEYWTTDGVHPTTAGHALIANEWKKAFEQYCL